jgi:lipid A 4'-phosphatase
MKGQPRAVLGGVRKERRVKALDTEMLRLLAILGLLALLFASVPGIDLAVSHWFYVGTSAGGFVMQDWPLAQWVRGVLWDVPVWFAWACLGMILITLWRGREAASAARFWRRGLLYLVLGPGVLVNLILKANWGRARPVQVSEFGGQAAFSPPFEIVEECAKNCSFVSGEASMMAAFGVLLWIMLAGRVARVWAIGVPVAMFAVCAGLRVAMGGHFLSDVLFGGLFMLILARAMGLRAEVYAGPGLGVAAIGADLRAAAKAGVAVAARLISRLRGH